MNLSFMDAVHGGNKELRIQTQEVCGRCSGKRAEPGTTLQTCPTCRGSGEVRKFCTLKWNKHVLKKNLYTCLFLIYYIICQSIFSSLFILFATYIDVL